MWDHANGWERGIGSIFERLASTVKVLTIRNAHVQFGRGLAYRGVFLVVEDAALIDVGACECCVESMVGQQSCVRQNECATRILSIKNEIRSTGSATVAFRGRLLVKGTCINSTSLSTRDRRNRTLCGVHTIVVEALLVSIWVVRVWLLLRVSSALLLGTLSGLVGLSFDAGKRFFKETTTTLLAVNNHTRKRYRDGHG